MDSTRNSAAIELDFGDLGEGETRAGELCPSCEGGSTREGTLSVTRKNGTLLWFCHRDSCGFKGAAGTGLSARDRKAGRGEPLPRTEARGTYGRQLLRTAEVLPEDVRQTLRLRYSIDERHLAKYSVGWDARTSRIVLPVLSRNEEALGCVLRSISGDQPKTLNYTEEDALAWFTNAGTSGIIIVEDQLSAIRASDYLTSVALLGTTLNLERVLELRAAKQPVYMALDNDAINTAVKHVIKWRSILPMKFVRLTKDIKDMSNEEADDLFAGIGTSRLR